MLRASTFASSSAIATSAAWPSTLGAVKLALSEPSLLTAQPRIRAMTSLPSATASDSRLRSTNAAPSLKTVPLAPASRSEEHTSDLQSLMRIQYAVFCLKKNISTIQKYNTQTQL